MGRKSMPRDMGDEHSAQVWMKYARADLELARISLPAGAMYEQLCFHAEQAVEKSLKAVLASVGIDFPPTHSLQRLIDLIPAEITRSSFLVEATRLTVYATALRYPGDYEPVTEQEHQEAVGLAEAVISWAESLLE